MNKIVFLASLTLATMVAGQITVMSPMNNARTAILYPSITTSIPLRYHCDNIDATVCLQVQQIGVGAVLDLTCISCDQNDHTLQNMGVGDYELVLSMKDESNYNVTQLFQIVSVEAGLPEIVVPSELELLASPPMFRGDIALQYELRNAAMNAVKQIEICIAMENVITGAVALPQSCVRSDHNVIQLNAVAEGDYRLSLVCRMAHHPFSIYPDSEKFLSVHIHRSAAFEPSYVWKRVRAWETVPTGLEIRLPIGDTGGQKVAKIPEPWRLQLAMPAPCKYFLRMDVHRHTSAADILNAAAKRCNMPAECFELIVGDKEISHEEIDLATSESANFFQEELAIEVLPICQKDT